MRSHDVTGRTQQAGCDCHMHVSARAGRARERQARERQGVPGSVFKTGFEVAGSTAAAVYILKFLHPGSLTPE